MKLPLCNHRRAVDGETNLFRCAHPKVHTLDDVVTGEICRICTHHISTLPAKMLRPLPPRPKNVAAFSRRPQTVAVVIPCHNYGCYLAEAIESVLAQTRPADEIVVVDDASTDTTGEVARSFSTAGVTYLRVDERHSARTRRAGCLATRSEVLCFLDGDDVLDRDYLARGLAEFDSAAVGIVYSDVEYFGERTGRSRFPEPFERGRLAQMNFVHSGSLVRRDALDIARAFDALNDDRVHLQDWLLWRRIARHGWLARKQPSIYRYRIHSDSMSARRKQSKVMGDYFAKGSLDLETVILFVPLSGRTNLWPRMAAFLDRQTWPHAQTRLILFDSSQDENFGRLVRGWVAGCDYADVRHWRAAVGAPALADRPRRQAARDVGLAMARIYGRLSTEATTDYVWIIEDDVLPPLDACERLLRGFDQSTASVSGAYLSRFAGGYVAWARNQRRYSTRGSGLEAVGGNGFGCVVIRGDVLRETVFTATIDLPAYDNAFYHRLPATGMGAKLDWSVECEHAGALEARA